MSKMLPIFYLIISSCSMIDLVQLLNLISKSITSPTFLAHYVNCLRLHHQMRSEFDGFHIFQVFKFSIASYSNA
jgi:lipid A disaccharide synthetase